MYIPTQEIACVLQLRNWSDINPLDIADGYWAAAA